MIGFISHFDSCFFLYSPLPLDIHFAELVHMPDIMFRISLFLWARDRSAEPHNAPLMILARESGESIATPYTLDELRCYGSILGTVFIVTVFIVTHIVEFPYTFV